MKRGVKTIIAVFAGAAVGAAAVGKTAREVAIKTKEMSDKHLALYMLMNRWVEVKQEDKNLADWFAEQGYKTIAIYGMNYVGETLLRELKGSGITVKYGIDQKADEIYIGVEMHTLNDPLPYVDAVVVTPFFSFDGIAESLSGKMSCPILSIEDILYEAGGR